VDSLDINSKRKKAAEEKRKRFESTRQQLFTKHGITASSIDEGKVPKRTNKFLFVYLFH
jgi:hypothetical protein